MMTANRCLMFAALLVFLPPAHAALQDQMADNCEAEIHSAETRIAQARKRPEYRSEQGRQSLTTADRWVNQARRHAIKGESRNCVTAAKKGRAQVSAR
jgi:ABC-type ATPase with predicted acetyltransferase domain